MKIYSRWHNENIDLTFDKTTIELTTNEAQTAFEKLSQILYGRILKDD